MNTIIFILNNIGYYQLLILIAQCIIVATFLLLFFRLRTKFGLGLFFIAIGLFKFMHYFFTQAFSLEIASGIQILIGPTIITPAILFSLLLIYIREDAGEVRKIIYALIFFNFFFAVILRISALGISEAGFVNKLNLPEHFFRLGIGNLIAGSLGLFVDGIILIVFYEFISKKISSLFLRIFLTMTTVLFLNAFIFNSVAFIFKPIDASLLKKYVIGILISKAISIPVYTITFWLYIIYFERRVDNSKQTASSFRDVFNLLTYRQKYALTQDKLKESEKKFRTLVEESPIGIFLDDSDGNATYINDKCAELIGVPPGNALNMNWVSYIHNDDRDRVTKSWAESITKHKNFSEDYRWVQPDGKVVWTHGDIVPVKDKKGDVIVFIGTLTNITERKQAEEKLKVTNEKLNANNQQLRATEQQLIAGNQELNKALEELNIQNSKASFLYNLSLSINKSLSIDDIIKQSLNLLNSMIKPYMSFFFIRSNEELNLVQACPSFKEIGFDDIENHKLGECLCGLSVSENKPIYSKNIHQDFRCTRYECKKAGLKAFAALPVRDGDKAIGLIGISSMQERDFEKENEFLETISEQISAALSKAKLLRTLKDNEARLKEAELIAQMGNFIWDISSGEVTWSDGLHVMLGYNRSEKLDYNRVNVEIHHPDDLERITAWLNECIASGNTNFPSNEYRLLRKDGKVIHVQTSIKLLYKDHVPIKMVGTVQNITERKQAEEALIKSKNRYQSLFDNSPIPLWEEDFSEVKKFIDLLRQDNVKDFKAYFKNHPEKVLACSQMTKITDVNKAVLILHEAKSKEDLFVGLPSIFTDKSYEAFLQELTAIAEGKNIHEFEGNVKTLNGKEKDVYIKWMVVSGYEDTLEKVYLSTTDITQQKQTEEALRKYREHLEELVKERTSELEKTLKEVERMNKLFVGREFRIKELREKINDLEQKLK